MRARYALITLLACLIVTGCQPRDPAQAMLEDYAYRIANVLEAEIREPAAPDLLKTLPPRRDRMLEIEDLRIGLLDYLDLKDCDMRHLVSQRNSVLGRVMPPSRQLVYEAKMLAALDRCHRYLEQNPPENAEFADLIAEARAIKRQQLPDVVWNASFATEELERALGLGNGKLQPDGEALLQESAREIRWLADTMQSILDARGIPEIDVLEAHYQSLAFNSGPGQLFQSMLLAIQWLTDVSQLLDQADLRRLCPQELPTRKARILQTVFAKFYAGQLQQWISMLHRTGGDWLLAMQALIDAQRADMPVGFTRYAQGMLGSEHPDSLRAHFVAAVRSHTQSWQRVLGHCGMMPSVESLQQSAQRALP